MPDDSWITPEYLSTLKQESEGHFSRSSYLAKARIGWRWYKKPVGIIPMDDFDDEEVDSRHATSRDNIIKETVDEGLSIFLKNDPVIRRYPHYPEDADLVDDVDRAYLSAWRNEGARSVVSSALRESFISGMSVVKVYWDVKKKAIAFFKPAPGDIFIDPFSNSDKRLTDCRYIIHRTRQRIDVVLQRYGTEAEIALGLRSPKGRKGKKATFAQILSRFASMSKEILNRQIPAGSGGASDEIADPFIDVYEYWIFPVVPNDVGTVTGDGTLDDSGYPHGVVVTMIEDRIVKTKKNPFAGKAKRMVFDDAGIAEAKSVDIGSLRHPFAPYFWDRLSDDEGNNRVYNCMGMVEQMIPMQFNIDAIRRQIYINAKTTANPGGIIVTDALDTPAEEITFGPGELIETKDVGRPVGDIMQRFNGQALPNYIFEMVEADGQKVKQRVGMRPGVTGQFPRPGTSHTPALTIGAVQEQEFGPLWEHVKELGFALEDMSVLMDGLMQQFYKVGDFLDVSEQGETRKVEWTQRHITANFRREVVAAATTSFFDLDKANRLSQVAAAANEAMLSENPDLIQSTITLLVNMGYPDAFDWIQQLRQKLQQLQQQQQELQALGALGLAQQAAPGGIPQQALPEQGSEELSDEELDGLEQLEQLTGVSAEELMIALEQ
jgi:hypothetical protein